MKIVFNSFINFVLNAIPTDNFEKRLIKLIVNFEIYFA